MVDMDYEAESRDLAIRALQNPRDRESSLKTQLAQTFALLAICQKLGQGEDNKRVHWLESELGRLRGDLLVEGRVSPNRAAGRIVEILKGGPHPDRVSE